MINNYIYKVLKKSQLHLHPQETYVAVPRSSSWAAEISFLAAASLLPCSEGPDLTSPLLLSLHLALLRLPSCSLRHRGGLLLQVEIYSFLLETSY